MVLGQIDQESRVLDRRQENVAEVLPLRHPALDRPAPEHPAPEDRVAAPLEEGLDQVWYDRRIVLVVGMDHHHDIRAALEGRPVAGLLVSAVSAVPLVPDDVQAEATRFLDRVVARGVVHQDHVVHGFSRNVRERARQGLLRVVGRHDHGDLPARRRRAEETFVHRCADDRPAPRSPSVS